MSTLLGSLLIRSANPNVSSLSITESTMTTRFVSILSILGLATFSGSALAATPAPNPACVAWESPLVSYPTSVSHVDASSTAAQICSVFHTMQAECGDVEILTYGTSSDNEHFVRDIGSVNLDNIDESSLSDARRSDISKQVLLQCQDASDYMYESAGNPHAAPDKRVSWVVVKPKLAGGTAAMQRMVGDVDEDFDFLVDILWDQRNNVCPVIIWGDAATGRWAVQNDHCVCSQDDVSPLEGYQVYSEAAMTKWLERYRTDHTTTESYKWSEIVSFLADNPRNWNEVNEDGVLPDPNTSATDGGGIGIEVHYSGTEVKIYFPDRCAEMQRVKATQRAIADASAIQAEEEYRLRSYRFDGYGRLNAMAGGTGVCKGSPFQVAEGFTADGILEGGVHIDLGSHPIYRDVPPPDNAPVGTKPTQQQVGYQYVPVSLTLGGLFGVGTNPNVNQPATIEGGATVGLTFNRAYDWQGEFGLMWLRTGGPFDDGDGNYIDAERDRILVRGGFGRSFGTGTHSGYLRLDGYLGTDLLSARAGDMFSDTSVPEAGAMLGFGWDF